MKRQTALVGTLMLTGCASWEAFQTGQIDAVPVAPNAPQVWAAAGIVGVAEEGPWLNNFNDPVMQSLVGEALEHNYTLAAQLATLRAAAADARAQRGSLLPFISGSASTGGRRSVAEDANGDAVTNDSATYGLGLNASWEADLWGRLAAGVDIVEADQAIAEADLAAAQLSIAGQTAIAWINLNAAVAQESVAQATLEARSRTTELTERRFSRGLATALDVRLARSALAGAEASIAARRQAVGEAARRLEVLLGRYPAAEIAAPANLPAMTPIGAISSPTRLLARRPDIASAEARVVQAGLRAEQARLALFPSLNVTASLSTSSDDLSKTFDPAFIAANALANLTQPLYAGGQLSARAEAFLERVEISLASYASTVLVAWREVEDALAADGYLATQENAQKRALQEAAFAEDLAERQYQAGTVTIFNLIDAQTRRLNAESALVSARTARATNRVQYYLALGGGPDGPGLTQPSANAGSPGGSPTP
ncbi:MAG: efflux transporter outer membrane subunit [Hyphomonadaceae bacterium]|nr:efflux transporter outer membrane subunit [Hyphomonadaceae bacterium]